jgi:hypothetical protein
MMMRRPLAALAALLFLVAACDDNAQAPAADLDATPADVVSDTATPTEVTPPDLGTVVETNFCAELEKLDPVTGQSYCRTWSEIDPTTRSSTGGWIELACTSRPDYSKCQVEVTSSVSYLDNKTFGGTGEPAPTTPYMSGNEQIELWIDADGNERSLNVVYWETPSSGLPHEYL